MSNASMVLMRTCTGETSNGPFATNNDSRRAFPRRRRATTGGNANRFVALYALVADCEYQRLPGLGVAQTMPRFNSRNCQPVDCNQRVVFLQPAGGWTVRSYAANLWFFHEFDVRPTYHAVRTLGCVPAEVWD